MIVEQNIVCKKNLLSNNSNGVFTIVYGFEMKFRRRGSKGAERTEKIKKR